SPPSARNRRHSQTHAARLPELKERSDSETPSCPPQGISAPITLLPKQGAPSNPQEKPPSPELRRCSLLTAANLYLLRPRCSLQAERTSHLEDPSGQFPPSCPQQQRPPAPGAPSAILSPLRFQQSNRAPSIDKPSSRDR